ncbi:MAG: hypothetical protein AAGA56_29460 [Myxococcota bacterium]
MQQFGIDVTQLSAHGDAAVQAAERLSARTVVYRDRVPVAAIVPWRDFDALDADSPTDAGRDPLLTLCGTCSHDVFVDQVNADMSRTVLFRRK